MRQLLKLNVRLFFQRNQTLVMFAVCLRLDLAWVKLQKAESHGDTADL